MYDENETLTTVKANPYQAESVKTGTVQAALLSGAELGRIATQNRGGVPWKGN